MTTPVCVPGFKVESERVKVTEEFIEAEYEYNSTTVDRTCSPASVRPSTTRFQFRTSRKVARTGVMLVGIGGNNGTTFAGGVLANKLALTWRSKRGLKKANFFGSLTQASTTCVGVDSDTHQQVFAPLRSVVPMLSPNDLAIGGWDISGLRMDKAMERAQVYPLALQKKLAPSMRALGHPLPSVFYPSFIASNQSARVDNVLAGDRPCAAHLAAIRADIGEFKAKHKLDTVIVLWTANTERFCVVLKGVHDSEEKLLAAIGNGHAEVAPSQLFAVASILEGCAFINGSPQNTFVPAIVSMAKSRGVFIGGDDFKSGQTKIKSVLADFLVSSALKPLSIVSYNHLGNNDGRNLAEAKTFRSKEISKSGVVEDVVASNDLLYAAGERPDHCVVIKYVPAVNDSKRAMDEYIAEIFMGGWQTFAMHNTCEDSLLAAPLILDLVVFTELFQRVTWKTTQHSHYQHFGQVLTILSFLLKAPKVPKHSPLVNALFKQKACIENILRALVGLPPISDMLLEYKTIRAKL